MLKSITKHEHLERINKVIRYLYEHPMEEYDLDKIAGISGYSPYHIHRILRAHLGEPVGTFLQRIRLDGAAHQLRLTQKPVQEIAWECGYEMASSFSKAFRKRFKVSPEEFREGKSSLISTEMSNQQNKIMMEKTLKFKVKELKEKKIIYAHGIGVYADVAGPCWDKVCTFAKEKRLFGFKTEFLGLSYDDPGVTEPEKCRYEACVVVSKEVKPEGEIGYKTIPAGKYLIVQHNGPYENFSETYNYIYGKIIPDNNFILRNMPCFEHYLNSPEKTKPEKLKTDICIPIE
ncbi:MAG: AraC family transcriptional regulator [Bacteroidetes bacterium HGW-Bacteroidetes-21]|nr:MAG: AraC family transcriptional regulator [Bacteroidetes bacterium HGW-Bacteroidetes-21]